MESDHSNVDRRSFLKRAGITAAVSLAATSAAGSATAADGHVEARYADPLVTELAVERHASGLLAMLADDDLLETADPAALHTRKPAGYSDVAKRRDGTVHLVSGDGSLDRIVSVRQVEDGVLSVGVEPKAERSYAFFEPDDGSTRLYRSNGEVYDLDADDCNTSCYCISVTCSPGEQSRECEVCCDGECNYTYFCEC